MHAGGSTRSAPIPPRRAPLWCPRTRVRARPRARARPDTRACQRAWRAAAWRWGCVGRGRGGVFVLFLSSLTKGVTSDGANNALQAWDLLHGQPAAAWLARRRRHVLHIQAAPDRGNRHDRDRRDGRQRRRGRAIPGRGGSRGPRPDRWVPIGIPDHTGTSIFPLVSCLLIDRATTRCFTAPLLCVILCAGRDGRVRRGAGALTARQPGGAGARGRDRRQPPRVRDLHAARSQHAARPRRRAARERGARGAGTGAGPARRPASWLRRDRRRGNRRATAAVAARRSAVYEQRRPQRSSAGSPRCCSSAS
jgi:hypothetical protein